MRLAERVDLVHLVCLIHLVGLVQPNKRDKPNNGLLTPQAVFSILMVPEELTQWICSMLREDIGV